MKLKVTPKDLTIFCIFCLFLLYFSAIAVLNVLTLINEGEFYGFNPIEGFSPKYLFGTLLVFSSVLIASFLSVSSSIFEATKGFGIELGDKKEDGYSRWLKEKEMKKAYKIFKVGVKDEEASAGGVVFINDGKNMWVDDGENHTLVIGVTGSGKTTAVVDPLIQSLCKHGESMVITDPKGEIYKNHSNKLRSKGYNIIVLNFRNPNLGNAWNPLTLPYRLYKEGNIDKAIELVDDVALNILQDKKANDPFWEKSASDYFSGCALGLLEDAKESEVNLNSINFMTTVGEEKSGPGSTLIKDYFTMKGESSSPYVFASNTINSPTETKGGILAVFRQKIRLFSSREQLSEMLAYSDFNMRDIGKEKTAVFMVIHDEKTTYHALATIFIKQCYETLIDVAQECGGALPYRTNFILDEFANMPPLKDVTTMVTAARSRKIRFTFIIQNFAQLNEVYGKEDAETIRSNCGNLMYLLTTELAALEEISKLCGEVKSKKDDKTASQPLVTVSDLQKLKMNEVIILRNRNHPFRTKLKQGFDTDWGGGTFERAEFVERETKPIELFDIKDHVEKRKKSKGQNKVGIPTGAPSFGDFMKKRNEEMNRTSFDEYLQARHGGELPTNPLEGNKKPMPKPILPSIDVDSIVKRIDAKIAELEAQEKAEEEERKRKEAGVLNIPDTKVESLEPIETLEINKPIITEAGFNPFAETENDDSFEKLTGLTEEKPIIIPEKEVKEEIKEEVNKPPRIDTFHDLLSQNLNNDNNVVEINPMVMPERKPEIMISNPLDETSSVPTLPEEPIIAPPLGGIIDPTKQLSAESFKESNQVDVPNESDLIVEASINKIKAEFNAAEPKIEVPTKPAEIQEISVTNDSVDLNNVKIVSEVTDDEFFDDFFDED